MKKIPLRVLSDPQTTDNPATTITSTDIIRNVIRQPKDRQNGATIDEIRRGIRVLDALEHSDQVLELEDADYDELRAKVIAMPWGMIDKRLLRIIDDILDATDQLTLNDVGLQVPNGVTTGARV